MVEETAIKRAPPLQHLKLIYCTLFRSSSTLDETRTPVTFSASNVKKVNLFLNRLGDMLSSNSQCSVGKTEDFISGTETALQKSW